MSFATPDDRSYYRAPNSAHGGYEPHSPDQRLHSHAYHKGNPANESPSQVYHPDLGGATGSSHGYPPQPMTPMTGQAYPPPPPASSGPYYAMPASQQGDGPIPSPPNSAHSNGDNRTNTGNPPSENGEVEISADGVPVVPVGVSGGKMFRCRGYGECNKVFTRSEHLARHVRKHTGERPFLCHCGKAFSRLDNLRQHAATVHAEQPQLNETMLASLAPIHSALSQRASKEQRRRGEVVEVPKNAVERPRNERKSTRNSSGQGNHSDHSQQDSPYAQYHDGQWSGPPQSRPRTGNGYEYPYASEHGGAVDDAGPSRRPATAAGYAYPPHGYYDGRPPTAPGTGSSGESNMSQLPYPYRPMSSNGRELPVPAHYAENEPPSATHGPSQSPMYNNNVLPGQPNWSSPPPAHSAYPPHDAAAFPPAEGYAYPPAHHGSYPPREEVYEYPAQQQHGWQAGQYPPQNGAGYQPQQGPGGYNGPAPPESPFQYNASAPSADAGYPYPGYDNRKRRADDELEGSDGRKHPRAPSVGQVPSSGPPTINSAMAEVPRPQDPNWLPPTTERRSSLAISALLGSPPRQGRSRPLTADGGAQGQGGYEGEFYEPVVGTGAQRERAEGVEGRGSPDLKGDKIEEKAR